VTASERQALVLGDVREERSNGLPLRIDPGRGSFKIPVLQQGVAIQPPPQPWTPQYGGTAQSEALKASLVVGYGPAAF
jgi:hypothetical protein